jgi:hypothetical protein
MFGVKNTMSGSFGTGFAFSTKEKAKLWITEQGEKNGWEIFTFVVDPL